MSAMERKKRHMRIRDRLGSGGGFTFTEVLFTVLILLIVTTIVSEAISLAGGHYNEQLRESQAQLLSSSISSFVQNELTYASSIETDGDVVSFRSNARLPGLTCHFAVKSGGSSIPATASADTLGEIYLAWGESIEDAYPIVDQAFYDADGICAGIAVVWTGSSGGEHAEQFHVTVKVCDDTGSELTTGDFYVRPVSP